MMTNKKIIKQTYSNQFAMGPMKIRQPLPVADLEQVSPFILLHHAGPTEQPAGGVKARLSPHPHRGFEPVTFLFSGKMHHKDSMGNEGFLQSGDVQWMTAGSGVIHSEGPSAEFAKEGGTLELIQLWVNLPREHKMTAPKYQDMKKEMFPVIKESDGKIEMRLVAGNYKNQKGTASTFTNILAMMVYFEAGATTSFTIPAGFNSLLYVLDGNVTSNGTTISKLHMAQFGNEGEVIDFKAVTAGKALLLAGEPINEPMASYGPFVMNYPGEIKQAILDFEEGRMGILES